jgi:uncharacterized protein
MGNAATVQTIYQAFGEGDVPTILEQISDDVRWEAWDDNSAAGAGVAWMQPRQGKEGVVEFLGLISGWTFEQFEVRDLLESTRQVVSEMEVTYVLPNGTRVADQELHLWTFDDDGKVVRFRHYLDTAKHTAAHVGTSV